MSSPTAYALDRQRSVVADEDSVIAARIIATLRRDGHCVAHRPQRPLHPRLGGTHALPPPDQQYAGRRRGADGPLEGATKPLPRPDDLVSLERSSPARPPPTLSCLTAYQRFARRSQPRSSRRRCGDSCRSSGLGPFWRGRAGQRPPPPMTSAVSREAAAIAAGFHRRRRCPSRRRRCWASCRPRAFLLSA